MPLTESITTTALKKYKFDYIFHQAAISDTRVYNQELVMSTNVNSFYEIIELAKKVNVKHLLIASSSSVYGANKKLPFKAGNPIIF